MSALSNTFEASSFKANERQHNKSSLDREYKLLTANQSVFSNSKNLEREAYDDEHDKFWKEASMRSERKPSNKEDVSPGKEGLKSNNNYYKHEIQNLRSSLNEMRDKALKTKMMTSELRTTNTQKLEQVSDLEKERVKKLQAEREEEVAESLSHRDRIYSPLERNPIGSEGKKKVKMAYEQKEKEVFNRVAGNTVGKDKSEYENSNWNSRSPNQGIQEAEAEIQETGDFPANKSQGYFTNKELVRAKYEQYEKDLLKKKEKSQHKKQLEEIDQNEEQPSVKKLEESRVDRRVEERHYPVYEDIENQRVGDSISPERRGSHDEFSRALERKERKLREEYETIEREKSFRNRGLVYRETYSPVYIDDEERPEHKVEYPTKQFPNSEFLQLELEKLKDENQRIKREIQDIHKRNDIQKRHYSAKLTHGDFMASFSSPQDSLSGSRKLSKVKNQRTVEDRNGYSTVKKGDDIKKTIARARKSVHTKMENTKQERSWKESRQRSTGSILEDVFIGYKTSSRSAKFHAGTPVNHLRESAFLLARGIPTKYVSNRSLNALSQSVRSATSRSFRK